MLVLSNLSKRYGPKILFEKISLRIARGERMGLVGPNGAGKTMLLKCLMGFYKPTSGRIERKEKLKIFFKDLAHLFGFAKV